MIRKKGSLMKHKNLTVSAILAAILTVCLCWLWYFSKYNMAGYLSRRLSVQLPAGTKIDVQDSHGGFHGDGFLFAVARLTAKQSEEFTAEISSLWKELPMDEEMNRAFYSVWEQHGTAFAAPPEDMEGQWFYRDRFFEQYGEKVIIILFCKIVPLL